MSGHLLIETDDGNFKISFRDLKRFPGCLFAKCTENGRKDEDISIKYERNSKYLEAILKYVSDESGEELKKILSSSNEFLLAIIGDAEYLMCDDLAQACREALKNVGSESQIIDTIRTTGAFKSVCEEAQKANMGAVFLNLDVASDVLTYHTMIGLLDRKRFLVYGLYLHDEDDYSGWKKELKSCELAVKRPESELIHLITLDGDWLPHVIRQVDSNSQIILESIKYHDVYTAGFSTQTFGTIKMD